MELRLPPAASSLAAIPPCVAAFRGDVDYVIAYLAAGGDVDAPSVDMRAAMLIFAACAARDTRVVDVLLRAAANVGAAEFDPVTFDCTNSADRVRSTMNR